MAEKKTLQEQQVMVERMGVIFEQRGFTPMNGRVFAYLLMAEPPHKDFFEIQEFLKASKSTISTALKFLQARNTVTYITFSGDRKRYFMVDTEGWMKLAEQEMRQGATFGALLKDVLAARKDSKHLDFNERLEKVEAFYAALAENLAQFIEKWNAENE